MSGDHEQVDCLLSPVVEQRRNRKAKEHQRLGEIDIWNHAVTPLRQEQGQEQPPQKKKNNSETKGAV